MGPNCLMYSTGGDMICLIDLCKLINGELKGDPGFVVKSVNSLYKAGKDEITFSVKEKIDLEKIEAGALIVTRGSKVVYPNIVIVEEPYQAFAALLNYFFPHRKFCESVDSHAYVDKTAKLGKNVTVGMFSFVGEGCIIGDETEIHASVTIYPNVKIGKNCILYSNVVIREDVEIGDHVIIQPGAVIGADGFGFTRLRNGTPVKIPQKGKVIIGNYCEIGANTCIDRSTIEETVLNEYVKLDNLVQVGHNVRIGRGTAISSQTGISGSATIGENVIMGGQVGVADHVNVADGAMIAGGAGVTGHIKTRGTTVGGRPYQEIHDWRRSHAVYRNLPDYIDRIKALENKIKELEHKVNMEEK